VECSYLFIKSSDLLERRKYLPDISVVKGNDTESFNRKYFFCIYVERKFKPIRYVLWAIYWFRVIYWGWPELLLRWMIAKPAAAVRKSHDLEVRGLGGNPPPFLFSWDCLRCQEMLSFGIAISLRTCMCPCACLCLLMYGPEFSRDWACARSPSRPHALYTS
jgi:hypothetical protein